MLPISAFTFRIKEETADLVFLLRFDILEFGLMVVVWVLRGLRCVWVIKRLGF